VKLTRRLFALSLVALAPAVGIQIYNEAVTRRTRETEVRELAIRNAQQAASELERVLEGTRNVLTSISKVDAVQALDTPVCIAYLAKLQPEMPHLISLAAVDLDGRLRCRQEIPPNSPTYADRPYVQQALRSGEFAVGGFTEARIAKRFVLPVATPLKDQQGRLVGVVAAAIDLQWLTERLRQRGLPPGGSITVADRNGTIIAREPFPDHFIGTRIPDAFAHLVNAPEPGAVDVVSQDGTHRVLGYNPVSAPPGIGLYVSAGLSSEASFLAIDQAARQGLLIILVGTVFALLGAWAVGRRFITDPVRRLLKVAEAWRAGNLAARTGLTSREGEIGALGEEFDRVVEEISTREGAIRESETRFRELADSAPVLIWMSGPDRSGIYFNEPWLAFTGRSIEQELGDGWLSGIHPKDLPALETRTEAFAARRPFQAEFRMQRHDGEWRWVLDSGVPRFDPSGEFKGFIGSCVDITERKLAEERQKLLVNELNHRVKNTLATVQSLAAQTRRVSTSAEDFGTAFEARLLALSKTHDLLTAQQWEGAALSRLIEHEVTPYLSSERRDRLKLTGKEIQLSPRHALALGMTFHELATNAVKYGALSTDDGVVEVSWKVTRTGSDPHLLIIWSEHKGPPVEPPTRRGFGSRLVYRTIQTELQGQVVAQFEPGGLQVSIEVPLPNELHEPVALGAERAGRDAA
jgi:PAS domain S-box-containing protein